MQDFVSEYRNKYMWFYLMILLFSFSILYQLKSQMFVSYIFLNHQIL